MCWRVSAAQGGVSQLAGWAPHGFIWIIERSEGELHGNLAEHAVNVFLALTRPKARPGKQHTTCQWLSALHRIPAWLGPCLSQAVLCKQVGAAWV